MLGVNDAELPVHKRQVSAAEGKKLASELRCAFTEASAKYGENVNEAFVRLIAEIERMATTDSDPDSLPGNRCTLM